MDKFSGYNERYNLDSPVDFVVCWTKNGELKGGTALGMRIAKHYNIPIYNLAIDKDIESLKEFIRNERVLS